MKPFVYILLTGFYAICTNVSAQQTTSEWEKTSNFSGLDYFIDVVEDHTSGYCVLGAKLDKQNQHDLWIINYNSDGAIAWETTLETPENEVPKKIIQLKNGNFIFTASVINDDKEFSVLFALSSTGEKLWSQVLENGNTRINDLHPSGQGFICVGSKKSDEVKTLAWLCGMNENGEQLWDKTFDNAEYAEFKAIKELPDGGYALAGTKGASGKKDCDIMVWRVSPDFEPLWVQHLKSPGKRVWPACVCCAPDSCFLVVGWEGNCLNDINSEYPVFDYNLSLTKIDARGNVVWTKSYDREGSEGGNGIAVLPDGSCLVAGLITASLSGKVGPWIIKTDGNGEILDEKLLNMRLHQAAKILYTTDGNILVIGPGQHERLSSQSNGWIIKSAHL